ncbi:hypothetical protein HGM15179_000474, partial [Zosterops borbonicus]
KAEINRFKPAVKMNFHYILQLSNINIKNVKQEKFPSWCYAKDMANEQVIMCDKFGYQMACVNTWTL